jgi:tryptophan synthase beta chain
MQLLGAEVVPVTAGQQTLKEAVNEAMRDWVTNIRNTHYILGTAYGAHPYPVMVRNFQRIIGEEARQQILEKEARLPDLLIACVGGGSNAIGLFHPFLADKSVKLVGVEAGGRGLQPEQHAARFHGGSLGVLQGTCIRAPGRRRPIQRTNSVSARTGIRTASAEHAWLRDAGRANTPTPRMPSARCLPETGAAEGIIPALESDHDIAEAIHRAPQMPKDALVIVNLSGRGARLAQAAELLRLTKTGLNCGTGNDASNKPRRAIWDQRRRNLLMPHNFP